MMLPFALQVVPVLPLWEYSGFRNRGNSREKVLSVKNLVFAEPPGGPRYSVSLSKVVGTVVEPFRE